MPRGFKALPEGSIRESGSSSSPDPGAAARGGRSRLKMKRKSTRARLLSLQKRLYASVRGEARRLLGATPRSIEAYRQEYESDFATGPRLPRQVTRTALVRRIRASDVTFIADYHTFSQAQRTALRIAREAIHPGERWWIGLEMIPVRHQGALDAFQQGRLPLPAFLRTIRYAEEWGFPWANYAPLFEWARANQVRLVALNWPGEDLADRDRWAARTITNLFALARELDPRARPRMIALYGELHLARAHLPRRLAEESRLRLADPLSSVTIHQNHERLYWKLAKAGARPDGIVRLAEDAYCAFSGTPWAKLQSLVTWAEGEPARHMAPSSGMGITSAALAPFPASRGAVNTGASQGLDLLSLMRHFGGAIFEFLGELPGDPRGRSPGTFEDLNIATVDDAASLLRKLESPRGGFESLSRSERLLVRYHIRNHQRIYVPKMRLAYLAIPSENSAAELAAIHLRSSRLDPSALLSRTLEELSEGVLQRAFGFFGSLILNPNRKCDLIDDHRSRARELSNGLCNPIFPDELQSRELAIEALRCRTFASLRGNLGSLPSSRLRGPAIALGTRYLALALAKGAHEAMLEGRITSDEVREIFLPRAPRTPVASLSLLWEGFQLGRLGSSKREEL